jgi:PAS domain S-box-containing protein
MMQQKTLVHRNQVIDENIIYTETNLKGIITYASKAFCDISGYTKDELINYPHNIVRHEDSPSKDFESMWKIIKSGKKWHGVVQNKNKNSESYWVKATVAQLFDIENNLIGYCSVRQDITELQLKSQLLEKQTRLAAMGEMIGMIAHQWRQPLTTMRSLMGKLKLKKQFDELDDETWLKSIEKHNSIIDYMDRTINDFLNFYRENNSEQKISVDSLINEPYKIVEALFEGNSIKFETDSNINEQVVLNIKKFEQVLMNLYKNSADEIIKNNIKDGMVYVKSYKEKEGLVIEVNDNGGGIPDDIIDKVFDPYFSTKSKNGTGLGLYMCKVIIEDQLKGTIEIFNRNYGAVCKIWLPLIIK